MSVRSSIRTSLLTGGEGAAVDVVIPPDEPEEPQIHEQGIYQEGIYE